MARPQDRWTDAHGNPVDEADRGLVYDVRTLVSRRRALGLFSGIGVGALAAGCGLVDPADSGGGTTTTSGPRPSGSAGSSVTSASGDLTEVPDETAGPFPGDGSKGIDVLDDSGIVRRDLRSTFGDAGTVTAEGVPLTVRLTVRDASTGDARTGSAIYVWHCDREGRYSLYTPGLEDVNYLRGVQTVDDTGTATFTTVFPGCYQGRWPHIHFEVYADAADATRDGPIVKTSQIALPKEACDLVYATDGYEQSVSALAGVSLSTDLVFSDDGGIHQIASMSGSADDGYVAALTIGV
ncbi:MAG: 3,4-dioxygenase subunit beta [Nocardioidaceae bacterium]|nr:3,4-dioxygenase subunit beta [Nocardioidaceae bacterium]NUS51579.1 3,4-dioxygenase subunit beta [Nocardioidaceae bacterium]